VAAVLAGCDRAGAHGRRDYAIVLLLARLGLRAGEVSAIELDDLDWRAGELTVRGKGGRREVLPLPVEVGQALADYVRHGRPPHCPTRRMFVSVRAPFTGLAGGSVFAVVARGCQRAGIAAFGPHRLRHALACDLLRRGASLTEVGQLLRHSDERTAAVAVGGIALAAPRYFEVAPAGNASPVTPVVATPTSTVSPTTTIVTTTLAPAPAPAPATQSGRRTTRNNTPAQRQQAAVNPVPVNPAPGNPPPAETRTVTTTVTQMVEPTTSHTTPTTSLVKPTTTTQVQVGHPPAEAPTPE
jgi:hypothetical protein